MTENKVTNYLWLFIQKLTMERECRGFSNADNNGLKSTKIRVVLICGIRVPFLILTINKNFHLNTCIFQSNSINLHKIQRNEGPDF